MIKSFKHKGLQKFYEAGITSGIQANHQQRLRMQLAALNTAKMPEDLNLPGFRLHPLKGNKKNLWSITVSNSPYALIIKSIEKPSFRRKSESIFLNCCGYPLSRV